MLLNVFSSSYFLCLFNLFPFFLCVMFAFRVAQWFPPTFCSYPKGGTFTTKLDLKNECLINHKTVKRSTKPRLLGRCCVCPAYAGHTPKAFQIVQKYKFSFTNQVFGVLFFQRVQVPYERIENPNR